ncbi:MAG: hypothetical protein FWE90_08795 [Defluviitaleaceae bacterium]|nr:hypothetical protein [Defluviitaleaceae bacterium]
MKNLFDGSKTRGIIFITLFCTFIFYIFLQPIADALRNYSGNIKNFIVDYYYIRAASIQGYDFVTYVAFIIAWIYFLKIFNNIFTLYKDLNKSLFNETIIQNKGLEIDHEKEFSIEKAKKELEELKRKSNLIKKEIKNKKLLIKIIMPLFVLFFLHIAIYQYGPTLIKSSFDNAIVKITPYVESDIVNILKSDWKLMKSRSDFVNIRDRINEICDEHNLW